MNNTLHLLAAIALVMSPLPGLSAQHNMPPGMTHDEHLDQLQKEEDMNARGARAMGFDQNAVAHHFLLAPTGGTIRVEVKDPADAVNREAIRVHLREIASDFAKGVFEAPFATHAEVPAGVPIMQARQSAIQNVYAGTADGADVRLATAEGEARAAVHAFLRYQITEHHTGDSLDVPIAPPPPR
jgi:hypothetical protein